MNLQRFTRLINAHGKNYKHQIAMQANFFARHNSSRKREASNGQTAAITSGLTEKACRIRELLEHAATIS